MTKKMEALLSLILLIGILLSISFVLFGGILYLLQHGQESLQTEILRSGAYKTSLLQIWGSALSFSPLGIIELGFVILVAAQILRVFLLNIFYILMRDYWFIAFSLFILLVLLYSFLWRN